MDPKNKTVDNAWVEKHKPLVIKIAQKLRSQLNLSMIDMDDLIALGLHGLLQAHERFDAEKGVMFTTFAYYRIRGAMIDGVRKMIDKTTASATRRSLTFIEAVDDINENVHQDSDKRPSFVDLHGLLASANTALGRISTAFVLACVGEGSLESAKTPESNLLADERSDAVRLALGELPERERQLLTGFYFDGLTLDESAQRIGVSKSWASRMHAKVLDDLRKKLGHL